MWCCHYAIMQWKFAALLVSADLPIHCLYQDVVGDWTFYAGATVNALDTILPCGHSIPNNAHTMALLDPTNVVPLNAATYKVTLTDERDPLGQGLVARLEKAVGVWTLVYDEGIEVRFPSRQLDFFAHFSFSPLNASMSQHDSSYVNWDHISAYEGRHTKHLAPRGDRFLCRCNVTSAGWYSLGSEPSRGCFFAVKKQPSAERRMRRAAEGSAISFLEDREDQRATQVLSPRALWAQLRLPEELALIEDNDTDPILSDPTFLTREVPLNATLPRNFDWRKQLEGVAPFGLDNLGEEKDQGACGSCYAFAATLAFQMRVRIALLRKYSILAPIELSWRAPTQCSPYTEGCGGGFSFLVYRHFKEVGVPPLSCDATHALTLEALEADCKKDCYDAKNNLFFAQDYGYVGGYSQASTADSIMREIYRRGPVVVGIAVDAVPEFYNGKNGQYIDKFMNGNVVKEPGHKFIPPWMWTTHAIVCVGWGEVRGEKYWVVRNSWGKDWGDVGYARIRRGRNDAGGGIGS